MEIFAQMFLTYQIKLFTWKLDIYILCYFLDLNIYIYHRHWRKCEFGRIKSDSILACTFIYGRLNYTNSPVGGYM